MEDMDMLLESMEEMGEEQLRQIILRAEELIADMKKPAKEG